MAGRKLTISPSELKILAELRKTNTAKEIEVDYGFSRSTLNRELNSIPATEREAWVKGISGKPAALSSALVGILKKIHALGYSQGEISRKLSIAPSVVQRALTTQFIHPTQGN